MRTVAVSAPMFPDVEKRLVEEAVVANDEVEVAFVVVAFTPVKFCKVVEEVTRRFVVVALPLMVRPLDVVPPPMVEEAFDWNPFNMPREVREDAVTPEARVEPVRLAAGTVPENAPDIV